MTFAHRCHPASAVRRGSLPVVAALILVLVPTPARSQSQEESKPFQPAAQPSNVPAAIAELQSLQQRKEQQLKSTDKFNVFYGFQFEDRLVQSGIRFRHQVVDDAGKAYKPAHYDHGTGVAIADVDGDGRYDIYFVSQLGPNQLWKNLGGGKFADITGSAGVAVQGRIHVAASFADIDNDGDPDLYVTTVRQGNVLFENDGQGRFKDISKASGLDYVGHSSTPIFFDYDNDGRIDLFLTNVGIYTTEVKGPGDYYLAFEEDAFHGQLKPERTEASILYRNSGNNTFVDVSKQVGLVDPGWSGDASSADLNGDGYQDLYVLNMQGDDHYYENQGGKTFVEKTESLFPKTPWGAMGIKFFDYNNDGRMDLILTDMHSDMSEDIGPEKEKLKADIKFSENFLQGGANNIFGNAFYENLGAGKFREISDAAGVENYWPWGLSVGDLNADGFQDVFIASSMNYPFRYGINTLLLNNRGKEFLDSEFILGVEPRRGGRTRIPWFNLSCSGADKSHTMCKNQEGPIEVRGPLGSRSSVIFDLDDDGDQDIVTLDFGSEPQVLINNLTEKRDVYYLKIKLIGRASNRDGLGARVQVVAGPNSYTQVYDGKSGYLAQSSQPLYFGLDAAEQVDRIEVEWPSGRKQQLTENIAINHVIQITEID